MYWRLLKDTAHLGSWNMAVDEAMLISHASPFPNEFEKMFGTFEYSKVPTLRFYDWNPACLSIGRFQKMAQLPQLQSETVEFDWVRRPTGGRAVWHQHEVTYCAVLREEYLPRDSRSVLGAYRWLGEGFMTGLQTFGVQATLAPADTKPAEATSNCFAAATRCDFVVDGRKLIGAAQCRHQGVILQHGSLLLDIEPQQWQHAGHSAAQDVVTLRSLGIEAAREEVIEALCQGFSSTRSLTLAPGELSETEFEVAKHLQSFKYKSLFWNTEGKTPSGAGSLRQDRA